MKPSYPKLRTCKLDRPLLNYRSLGSSSKAGNSINISAETKLYAWHGNYRKWTMEIGNYSSSKNVAQPEYLDECDGPLGAAGAHPPAHGKLLPDPGGALVLPALHFRHPDPPAELPHGVPRGRRRGRDGGRGGAVAAPTRGEREWGRKEGMPRAPETARCQPEKAAGGSGGRHGEGSS